MSDRPIVVIPGDDPPLVSRSPHLEALRGIADVRLYPDRPATADILLQRTQPATVLLNSRGSLRIPASVLEQAVHLRMIAVCGIGYDAIDLNAATRRGIVVCNIPGRTATVVAEHAVMLMLAVARRAVWMTEQLRDAAWPPDLGVSLVGRQLGVIGTGHIGCEVIRMSRAFGMQPVAWSFHPDPEKAARLGFRYASLRDVLSESDVVSLHVRLSDQSRQLLNSEAINGMKPGAILINTSRGAVVDTVALARALTSGHLFGAGIDVFEQEPVSLSNPLLKCDNVVLTPHSADQTQEGIDLLTQGCVENIRAFLAGAPIHVVNDITH